MNLPNFAIVTEHGGEYVTQDQKRRFVQRYQWASIHCLDKDVLEMACGTGPGLACLEPITRSLSCCDIQESSISIVRDQYSSRIHASVADCTNTDYADNSFDVIILFEALYYLADVDSFLREVRRLLRPGGTLLMATANKDLFDFHPSPFSTTYYNCPELNDILLRYGFQCRFYGGSPVPTSGFKHLIVRSVKILASKLRLIPKSMADKRLLKRLVYGPLVQMPVTLQPDIHQEVKPILLDHLEPNHLYSVLYCSATIPLK